MALQMFASIYIGSYEVSMKIFEFSGKKKIHEIDHVRRRIELGRDVFASGMISYERVDEVCDTLAEFQKIILGYRVENYEAYTSAGLREADNGLFVLDQINKRTGINVKVISNSEHRFITYQCIAGRAAFEEMIRTSAAVMDVGGTGIQVSLFRAGEIITTQFMDIGTIRLRSMQAFEETTLTRYEQLLEEYIDRELSAFCELYLEGGVDYVIFMNDYCTEIIRKMEKGRKDEELRKADKFVHFIDKLLKKNIGEISEALGLSNDKDPLIVPSMLLFKQTIQWFGAKEVWVPGVNINDGIAFSYAQRSRILKTGHNYEEDVLYAARSMAKHYHSDLAYDESLGDTCGLIYDSLKKVHGMGKRERLLLQVAAILHECGRFVSISNYAECGYRIILESEIIGLTHLERLVVALTVLYHQKNLDEYEELAHMLDKESYLMVAKLSAILRTAEAIDHSHKNKFQSLRISIKGKELVFSLEATGDISLERALFEERARYFASVFSIRPVIREKRVYRING